MTIHTCADTELKIDDLEFFSTMRQKLNFIGSHSLLTSVFNEIDTDRAGFIS